MQLCDKYRPKTWDDFIGQDTIIAKVKTILSKPDFGKGSGYALWISGPSGTGKTTLAQLISRAVGVTPGPAWNYTEIDGDKCTVEQVRLLDTRTQAAGLFCDSWQVFIINESHLLQHRAVGAWLSLLERLPEKWLVIFTTTQIESADLFGNFTDPLLSRCKVFNFTNQGLAQPMAKRLKEYATLEGMDGHPISHYLRIVQECKNNFRKALQTL